MPFTLLLNEGITLSPVLLQVNAKPLIKYYENRTEPQTFHSTLRDGHENNIKINSRAGRFQTRHLPHLVRLLSGGSIH